MCVIIIKKPGVTIPFPKIGSACQVNADGWGISVVRPNEDTLAKRMLTYTRYEKVGNDPQEVYDLIMKYNDHLQFIHLRFSTQGSKSLDNCHPFLVLDKPDARWEFMHNGTLSGIKMDTGESDTSAFARKILAPTAEAFYTTMGQEGIQSEAFHHLMDKSSGNGYFVTYNDMGQYCIAGGTGHVHDNDGWWSSNDYSFNRYHREPKTYYGNNWHASQDTNDEDPDVWRNHVSKKLVKWDPATSDYVEVPEPVETTSPGTNIVSVEKKGVEIKTSGQFQKSKAEQDNLKTEGKHMGYALAEARRKKLEWSNHTPPEERPTFTDLCNLNNLTEACLLTEGDLECMVAELPSVAVVLIMDLLHELYRKPKKEQKVEQEMAA